jgi:DNA-binding MarR family transcriptional regulator
MIRAWMQTFMMRSMGDWMRYTKEMGLSMAQFGILMLLYHKGSCGVHDIGDLVDITSAAASQLIERLVHSGLVERTEDRQDRRVRQVALSAKGRDFVQGSMERRFRWMENLAVGMTEGEREAVMKALLILSEAERKISDAGASGSNKKSATTTLEPRSTLC